MEITKEVFFDFLKKNNFYEGWMEGYNLDNEIYDDIVPLDDFFESSRKVVWLYSGPAAMAMSYTKPGEDSPELLKRWEEWREKYQEIYMDLDEKWMDFVNSNP